MIRFVDLGKQLAVDETDPEYPRQFAFYDTISDKFIELGQNGHVWDSWLDILQFSGETDSALLDRLWGLSPMWTKEGISPDAAARIAAGPSPEFIANAVEEFFRPSFITKYLRGKQ